MTNWRPTITFILLVVMMVALFLSRAMLSISMIVFFYVSFFHPNFKEHIGNFFRSPLLWSMSLLFFLPLISGLWSENKHQWIDILRIKLPLLVLPLAFATPVNNYHFSKKQWQSLAYIFVALITAGTIWSMFHYVTNIPATHDIYLQAQTMITPLKNDHVRFSWLISVAVLLIGWLLKKDKLNGFISWLLIITGAWLIIFLHILAVRTGLFSFYIIAIIALLWLVYKKIKPAYSIALFVVVILLPLLAYFALPTFQNRVRYFYYSLPYFKEANYLKGSNDAIRVISLKAGWSLMNKHPFTGLGFGDVFTETIKWYDTYYPQMAETEKIYPANEWIIHGDGIGWPGLLLFTFIMVIPFCISMKNKLPWLLLNFIAPFSFLFDVGLEVQFGVFIYSFMVLWWWKWLNAENM